MHHSADIIRALILGTAMAMAFDRSNTLADWQVKPATSGAVAASRSSLPAPKPWIIPRVLTVQGVAVLCRTHPEDHFVASVHGYLEAMFLNGPGAERKFPKKPVARWVGRLFAQPNPHVFFTNDRAPFVQVWGTKVWFLTLSRHRVTFHGILSCDAARYSELPGWQGSIRPDLYFNVQAAARVAPRVELGTH